MQQAIRYAARAELVANEPPIIDAETLIIAHGHNRSWTRPLPAVDRGKLKSGRSAWANGKLSLMLTLPFLEFLLSGFASASKPRAPQARLSAAEGAQKPTGPVMGRYPNRPWRPPHVLGRHCYRQGSQHPPGELRGGRRMMC